MAAKTQARFVPSLLARDLHTTASFYAGLGFEIAGRYPEEGAATWMELRHGALAIQFHAEPPVDTPPGPVMSGTLYVYGADVRTLADQVDGRIEFVWGPEVMDYGMFEFGVRDPDGYILAFAEPAPVSN
ncbi:MAG: hypothetical protein GKS06_13545 [Acidobacteria bacterium]|nr:hypothetical protein [Acidobacteriota bacterium]